MFKEQWLPTVEELQQEEEAKRKNDLEGHTIESLSLKQGEVSSESILEGVADGMEFSVIIVDGDRPGGGFVNGVRADMDKVGDIINTYLPLVGKFKKKDKE